MQKMWLFMSLLAVLGSHGIVVKCTAAIFFRTVDCASGRNDKTILIAVTKLRTCSRFNVVYLVFPALFLAYTNGAARLCRELLKAGGSLATVNKHGVSIFNAQVPTKKLLYTLLGKIFTLLYPINPLSPNSDKHLISPYSITTRSNIQVMRIKKMITNYQTS